MSKNYKEEKVIENDEECIVRIFNNGNKFWLNDKEQLHRLGGLPACEYASGNK